MREYETSVYRATFNKTKLPGPLSVQVVIEFSAFDVDNPFQKAWETFHEHTGRSLPGIWRLFHLMGCVGIKKGRDSGFPNVSCQCKKDYHFCQMHGPLLPMEQENSPIPSSIGLGPCDGPGGEI